MTAKSLQHANNKFGLNLFKVVRKDSKDKNTFLSPLSIQAAICMTFIGARDKTAQDMAVVLAIENFDDENIHKQFQAYFTKLRQGGDSYELSLANRIYVERSFEIIDKFYQDTKNYYLAEPVLANFKEESETERVKINTWVAEVTHNKIQDLLVSGVLNADSRMVLINAVYFQGKWKNTFLARETFIKPFKVSTNHTVNVPMMTAVYVYGFTKDSSLKCCALEMPYKGQDLSMIIIVPDEDFGLEELVQKLDVESFNRLITNVGKEKETILLSLPKFEITSAFALKHPLSDMGMAYAFSTSANFSGISSDRKGLHLSDVIHKSYLRVDEKGTEAATATAAIMIPECDIESTPLTADHPFLFAIIDRRFTSLLLFCGQITDPSIKP